MISFLFFLLLRLVFLIYTIIYYLKNRDKLKLIIIKNNLDNDILEEFSLILFSILGILYCKKIIKLTFILIPIVIFKCVKSINILMSKINNGKILLFKFFYLIFETSIVIQIFILFIKIENNMNIQLKEISILFIVINTFNYLFVIILIIVFLRLTYIIYILKNKKFINNWLIVFIVILYLLIYISHIQLIIYQLYNIKHLKDLPQHMFYILICLMACLIIYIITISKFRKNIINYFLNYERRCDKKKDSFIFLRISNNYFKTISNLNLVNLNKEYNNSNNLNINRIENNKWKNEINSSKKKIWQCMDKKIKYENFCIICETKDSNIIFNPCKHGNICYKCSKNLVKKNNKCIFCKKVIESFYIIEKIKNNIYIKREEIVFS